ncbi:hypothetical protein HQ447_07155 [bacterium]|nr:hypothetical protein [bacterium]
MNDNPLVTEIRKKRAEILATHQGDYHAMMNAMQQNQWESGHEVVNLARKDLQPAPPAKPAPGKATKLPVK